MAYTFDESKDVVAARVKLFRTNFSHYHAPTYKEASARIDFIDPLFIALGWDVHNAQHHSPIYKEVEVEESRDVEGHTKQPDYTFRMGREAVFFVEAKRPGITLKTAAEPAYQIRRYAWSQKLPLSILTDFEEFAVYEGRTRPNVSDKASAARVNFFTYEEYADRWREIWDVFSREAVLSGSFQQYADASKGKRGTSEVDAEFLKDIERWRDVLARNLALRNPGIADASELNDAVQRTLDRLIFLRIAEDRNIEPYERLRGLTLTPALSLAANRPAATQTREGRGGRAASGEGDSIYRGLIDIYHAADRRYNSGLFDFTKHGDGWMLKLAIDDRVLKDIIGDLYYPHSPYQFDRIPVEILGNVYEQFLGKVIRLTAGHQAKVEEKPEVKKAGGVFYTPAYIVDYIVKQTVGQAIEGKSPKQLKGFRVLDMACGSGSFMLGAYQYLLDYYLKWYVEHEDLSGGAKSSAAKRGAVLHLTGLGEWRLTIAEKKRILTEHLFGVDIDRQAVEVTKLSLLLKVLEGENDESLQLRLFEDDAVERALPNLDANIKCGNSLIGPDYFTDQLLPDTEEMRRINSFDWTTQFPETVKAGGFDVIVGNPPYGIVFDDHVKAYLEQHSPAFLRNNDMYVAFTQKAIDLLKPGGLFGFIIPNTFLLGPYFDRLKQHVLESSSNIDIVDFGMNLVFPKPNVFTALLFLQRKLNSQERPSDTARFARVQEIASFPNSINYQIIDQTGLESLRWTPIDRVYTKLLQCESHLDDIAWVKDVGLNYWTEGRGKTRGGSIADRVLYDGERLHANDKPYLKGRDINRYSLMFGNHWLRHDYAKRLDPEVDTFRFSSDFLTREKIIYRQTADCIIATLELQGFLTDKTVHMIALKDEWIERIDLRYVLGILNSRLFDYLYRNMAQEEGRAFAQVKVFRMKLLPIKTIDGSVPNDKAAHDRMVKLVDNMLQLHARLAAAKAAHDREMLQRQIDATDRQIDALVYELYGLTAEEIGIVEGR